MKKIEEKNVFRNIFGDNKIEESLDRWKNQELNEIYQEPSITGVIKS